MVDGVHEDAAPQRPRQQKRVDLGGFPAGITARACLIAAIAFAMLVPLFLLGQLVAERSQRQTEAIDAIAESWGRRQAVVGPLLVVPIQEVTETEDGPQVAMGHAVFLPETLSVEGDVPVETRARGIYEALLYSTELTLTGSFARPDFAGFPPARGVERTILWDRATLALGLSDVSAIAAMPVATWGGRSLTFRPGEATQGIGRGIHAPLGAAGLGSPAGADSAVDFSIRLAFNGSSGLAVAPVGATTELRLTSDWPHPSFGGGFLPDSHDIAADGFTAAWSVSSLARAYPQSWRTDHESHEYDLLWSTLAVELVQPVDVYTQTERAVKYGILFIGLTFLAVFLVEIRSGRPVHLVQYGLIGAALAVFYLLLLSLSEHVGFLPAYVAGALAVLAAIGWYSVGALGSVARAAGVSAILAGLYVVLYVLLSLLDYALLVGSFVVFAALVVAMAATRNLRHEPKPSDPQPAAAPAA
ncbi:MAG: cell envelope integrity protein CreD [Alphaproteobacteria bacterium]